MRKPFTIHDDDHSEKAQMMRKAFEVAFSECWYCEKRESTRTKLGQLICDKCNDREIRTMAPIHKMTEYQKATHLKIAIKLFDI